MRILRTFPLFLFLWSLGTPAFAQPVEEPGARRPGFYLSVGAGGSALSLDDEADARLALLGVDLESAGSGGLLQVGYAFSRAFALEMRVVGSEHGTGRADIDAGYGLFQLDVVSSLLPGEHVSPYLAGGVGGAVVHLEGAAIRDTTLLGGQVDMGGGVEVHVAPRWAVAFDYRFVLSNFEEEVVQLHDGERTTDVDLSGHSHQGSVRVSFSF